MEKIWIDANNPPKPKENWQHTEQCLVWYEAIENDKVEGFGISYYNYAPPFKGKGEWIDFAHYGRQPKYYQLIQPPVK